MLHVRRGIGILGVLALTNLPVLGRWLSFGTAAWAAACAALLTGFLFLNIAPCRKEGPTARLAVLKGGEELLRISGITAFLNLSLTVIYLLYIPAMRSISCWLPYLLLWIGICLLLTFNGCLRIYATSLQLGIKWRVLLFLLWWFPGVNLLLFAKIRRIAREEYLVETEKAQLNAIRRQNETCCTLYPLVLVHGVFFRDRKVFNYWGRIPMELIRNGATVFYGEQQSAAGTEKAAAELKQHILQIVEETGCGKVNIIAHSKGGLEARCAISRLGLSPYVASLTTINTPHRGCSYADYLLKRLPKALCLWVARRYNGALRKLGDTDPDFLAAVNDLTVERCEAFNAATPDMPDVFYQSVGSQMMRFTSAPFPQNVSYLLIRHFARRNDGLVGIDSMPWGDAFHLIPSPGQKGISHGDMIDLHRRNIRGFDVREFYVELVRNLKQRGF